MERKYFILIFFIFHSYIALNQIKSDSLKFVGFIQTDIGYNFNASDPDWFDVMRPTKLPSSENEFSPNGNLYFSCRQSRFGIRSITSTRLGELNTQVDFDLFGFGQDAGQTTFHLINAYGSIGKIGVGQFNSVFMNVDVFPVTLDYWGPLSRIYFQNIQIRVTPVKNKIHQLAFGIENPGASVDKGSFAQGLQLQGVKPNLYIPNVTAHYRYDEKWGFIQIAGVFKYMNWNQTIDTTIYELNEREIGWGGNISTVIHVLKNLKFKFQGVVGSGIENHLADPSPDIGLDRNLNSPAKNINGKAIPVFGYFTFFEISWFKSLRSSIGYSLVNVQNTSLQPANAFRKGQYALINLRCYKAKNVMIGLEYQFGRRENFKDDFFSVAHKLQFSMKCNWNFLCSNFK